MNPKNNQMLPEHIDKAIRHYVPVMEGWSSPDRCCEMAALVIEHKPSIVVEIGAFAGRATVSIAMALRENHHGTIYGLDPWRIEAAIEGDNDPKNNDYWMKLDLHAIHRQCVETIWAHRLEQWAVLIRARSEHCHELFPLIDFLFIDGCHSQIASCRDVELYVPKVVAGGIVIMDDCDWQTTQAAQAMIEEHCDILKIGENGHYKIYKKR